VHKQRAQRLKSEERKGLEIGSVDKISSSSQEEPTYEVQIPPRQFKSVYRKQNQSVIQESSSFAMQEISIGGKPVRVVYQGDQPDLKTPIYMQQGKSRQGPLNHTKSKSLSKKFGKKRIKNGILVQQRPASQLNDY
jgi:hypothetical protein